MSSDHEENAATLDVKSDLDASGSVVRGSKPRRRRRGKRRKHGREVVGESESNQQDSDEEDLPEHYPASSFAGCKLRPLNVPKAPENSTQFLIDDHNECRLYMSFETPNPYASRQPPQSEEDEDREIVEPEEDDAAYMDINYEYESPQDFDNCAYHDMEFELAYKSTRFEELLRLPRAELIRGLEDLETRLKELSDDLLKETNPSPVLNKLQHEFLELQEKHFELKECNARLRSLVMQQTGGTPDDTLLLSEQDETAQFNMDPDDTLLQSEQAETTQFDMDPEDPPVSSNIFENTANCKISASEVLDKDNLNNLETVELSKTSDKEGVEMSNVPEEHLTEKIHMDISISNSSKEKGNVNASTELMNSSEISELHSSNLTINP